MLFFILIVVAAVGWFLYLQPHGLISMSAIMQKIEELQEVVQSPQTVEGTLSIEDYARHYEQATDTLPNTLRVQLYGPSLMSGYDIDGNVKTVGGSIKECRNCSQGETLHLVLVKQGMSDEDRPLVYTQLTKQQKEYEDWVAGGRNGIFYSSVITVQLPTPPEKGDIAKSIGLESWFPMVIYGTGEYTSLRSLSDHMVADGDELTYVWTDAATRNNGILRYTSGWNFEPNANRNTEATNIQKYQNDSAGMKMYRKSFENSILQLPVFQTTFPDVLPKSFVDEYNSPEVQEQIKKAQAEQTPERMRDDKRMGYMNGLTSLIEMYFDDKGAYPATLEEAISFANLLKDVPTYLSDAKSVGIQYAGLGTGTKCTGYHLGAKTEQGTARFMPAVAHAAPAHACQGSAPDFSGTDPMFYDVKK